MNTEYNYDLAQPIRTITNLQQFVAIYPGAVAKTGMSYYRMGFGKYRGQMIKRVPESYYNWAVWALNKEEQRKEANFRGNRCGYETSIAHASAKREQMEQTVSASVTTPVRQNTGGKSDVTVTDRKKLLDFFNKED